MQLTRVRNTKESQLSLTVLELGTFTEMKSFFFYLKSTIYVIANFHIAYAKSEEDLWSEMRVLDQG